MKARHRILLFALAVASTPVTLSVMGQAPVTAALSARLGSVVFHWDELPLKPSATGGRRDVANQPTATLENLECHVSTLNPGLTSHPPHHHPQEELIIIKQGTIEVRLNGKAQRAGPGSLLFFAANDLHNMTNVGDTPATYVVFQLTTAATHSVPAGTAAEAARPGMLPSGVFAWEKLEVKSTKTGERRAVFDSPTATFAHFECNVTTLNPGEIPHAAHHHPDEEIVIVKDGTLQVEINGAAHRAGPDSIVFYGSGDEHGMKNIGPGPATYYVVRVVTEATPKPG